MIKRKETTFFISARTAPNMRASEVFTPGRFPSHTFVNDHLVEKKQYLLDALDTGSTLISISGPSKSGKTVFVEECVGKERIIPVTGAGVTSVEILWRRVFDQLGIPLAQSKTVGAGTSNTVGGNLKASGNLLLAKAEVQGTYSHQSNDNETVTTDVSTDYLQLLINQLSSTDLIIFIDDFHYIPRDIQSEIAKQIKEAIRNNVNFIVASVPYHADDVIRSNPDLRGRIVSIDFGYWSSDNLEKIATKGFTVLGVECNSEMISKIIDQAAGSPQLMQYLCLNTCFEIDVRESSTSIIKLPSDAILLERVCKRTVLSTDYGSVVDNMMAGPKVRGSDRNQYILKRGIQGDVYTLLVLCLAADPPQLTLRYENLVERVKCLCATSFPSGSSITGACEHMARIANDASNESVIEWDTANDILNIRDPYLLFYIRWAELFS